MIKGIPATGPTPNNYEFEKRDISEWPNVVSLEFAINTDNSWDAAKDVVSISHIMIYIYLSVCNHNLSLTLTNKRKDILIHFINKKFAKRKLPNPYYFFIELFNM